ncbi:hypothetical protein K7X08_012081 [Anisodus acutangulus]|uniref:Uncharacterized protein n=1 Tax=Anisodus acutangulus TaxID=402998 RepID=A0A9Q1LC69_9SOLA|nr:hypothetical protein K7X08_012081 [Anisodus acutangulus]
MGMFKTYNNPLVFTNILLTDEEKRTINFTELPQETVVNDVVVEPQVPIESGPSVHCSEFEALKKKVANYVDVIMYYMRKKAKYGPNNGVRYVTTDCFIKLWVKLIYQQFKDKNYDPSIITPEHNVAQVIRGYKIFANIG